jgi:uncharacterized protein YjbI with pentapeptide repeats
MDANLKGTRLFGAVFERAILRSVNLQNAEIVDANLMGADLTGANLSRASLNRVRFLYANLSGAIFRNAILNEVDFDNADLTNADFSGARDAEFDELYIFDTYLRYAPVKPINLNRIEKGGAIFCNTILPDGSICNDGCNRA